MSNASVQTIEYKKFKHDYFFITLFFLTATFLLMKLHFFLGFPVHLIALSVMTILVAFVSLVMLISWFLSITYAVYDGNSVTIKRVGARTLIYQRAEIVQCSYKYIANKDTMQRVSPFVIFHSFFSSHKKSKNTGIIFLQVQLANGKKNSFALHGDDGKTFAHELCSRLS